MARDALTTDPVLRGAIQYFPRALAAVADVSAYGASKYAWKGWESVPDGVNRYSDALGRHLVLEAAQGPIDPETGMLHAAQAAWNALARLELMLREGEDEKSRPPADAIRSDAGAPMTAFTSPTGNRAMTEEQLVQRDAAWHRYKKILDVRDDQSLAREAFNEAWEACLHSIASQDPLGPLRGA